MAKLIIVSVLSFTALAPPPDDWIDARISRVEQRIGAVGPRKAEALRAQVQRLEDRKDRIATRRWIEGYSAAGGAHLDVFLERILPCESGGTLDPDRAVNRRSGDHGRAQVNAYYWADEFTDLFGVPFHDHIYDPWYNGAMAAHIEQVQGLRAWVCYR